MLGNFIRLFFRQQKDNQAGGLPPQDQYVHARHVPPVDMPGLPDISAVCWRRLIVGETEIMTTDISLRFLLKNNVRYVKRAGASEETIAERIHITYSFFIKNRLLLDAEIKMLGRIEREGA